MEWDCRTFLSLSLSLSPPLTFQLLSLTFDGLTGVIQDSLKLKHDVRALHMMYAVNVISALYLALGMFLSGEGLEAVGFVQRHPYVMLNILAFGLASAIGQVCKVFCIGFCAWQTVYSGNFLAY